MGGRPDSSGVQVSGLANEGGQGAKRKCLSAVAKG